MTRYLGIDYGRARIGLALGDDETKMAFPRPVLEGGGVSNIVGRIAELAAAEGVAHIVLGLPPAIQGMDTTLRDEIITLADQIRDETGFSVSFADEMFTSRMAEVNSKKELSDSAAAALILQGFLDKQARQ